MGTESSETKALQGETAVTIPQKAGTSTKFCLSELLSKSKPLMLSVLINVILVLGIIILITLSATQPGKNTKMPQSGVASSAADCLLVACPEDWVGYLGKCYYFSETKTNWADSQNNCFAHGASLAVIDTPQEMDFMKRYKDPKFNYWLGLRRKLDQPRKWINGTEYEGWFTISGEGECAFLNGGGVGSSGCLGKQPGICSKPAQKPTDRAKGL
ncbi:early activation antigen CD69-like [Carettochelys insculpta]|uniref:early activation antigen CD69-like n=1 Tax=Carettochelys insculpta TaxID=44489 RepID=UPI003EBC7AA0